MYSQITNKNWFTVKNWFFFMKILEKGHFAVLGSLDWPSPSTARTYLSMRLRWLRYFDTESLVGGASDLFRDKKCSVLPLAKHYSIRKMLTLFAWFAVQCMCIYMRDCPDKPLSPTRLAAGRTLLPTNWSQLNFICLSTISCSWILDDYRHRLYCLWY